MEHMEHIDTIYQGIVRTFRGEGTPLCCPDFDTPTIVTVELRNGHVADMEVVFNCEGYDAGDNDTGPIIALTAFRMHINEAMVVDNDGDLVELNGATRLALEERFKNDFYDTTII